jgi:nucleoid-associated protein YgaU
MSRYRDSEIVVNEEESYDNIREERGVKKLRHYRSKQHPPPTKEFYRSLIQIPHVWSSKDRYWKLAVEHYGSQKYWYIIAWFNKKPTEAHVQEGDKIYIPKPLSNVLDFMEG